MRIKAPPHLLAVEGWREAFLEASARLDRVRLDALFPAITRDVMGRSVRWPTMDDWIVFKAAENPFFAGGERTLAAAANILWRLGEHYGPPGRVSTFWRRYTVARIHAFARGDIQRIGNEVDRFLDDAFLDCPGYFSGSSDDGKASAVNWPRRHFALSLCSEIMTAFPSFTFSELRAMPLPMFWQWIHLARGKEDPDYRPHQLTDHVNARATAEFNRARKAAAVFKE